MDATEGSTPEPEAASLLMLEVPALYWLAVTDDYADVLPCDPDYLFGLRLALSILRW